MDAPLLVGIVHGAGQGLDEPGRGLHRLRLAGELLGQAAAVDVFQHQVGPAVVLAHLVDLHDVRMLQPGDRAGLGAEPARDDRGPRGRRRGSS